MRAIKTARRLLEGPVGGAGSEGRGQLPRYVVVVSATDLEDDDGGDEVWLEGTVEEDMESMSSMAKTFATVSGSSSSQKQRTDHGKLYRDHI